MNITTQATKLGASFPTHYTLSVGLWNEKLGAWSVGSNKNTRIRNKTNITYNLT
jgi:hypothetical protein